MDRALSVEEARTVSIGNFIHVHLARMGTLCLLFLLLGACRAKTPSTYQHFPPGRPMWAETIRERSGSVETTVPSPEGIEAGVQRGNIPRGAPTDLTQPIALAASARKPVDKPRQTKPEASPLEASSKLESADTNVVIIDRTGELEDPDPTLVAEVPSSPIEEMYHGQIKSKPDREIRQFGYDYFAGQGDGLGLGPVPDDYIVGPGDEVRILAWGGFTLERTVPVDRDGNVLVPDEGALAVGGRRFSELHGLFEDLFSRRHKQFNLEISLGELRLIGVHVVGEVVSQSYVDVYSRTTVLEALLAAGGPKKSGSLRRVEVQRESGEILEIDLYELLVQGKRMDDVLVQEGDVIFVPPIGRTMGVAGYVMRPAIYESVEPLTVGSAIELAGGLTPFTFTPNIQIERTVENRRRITVDVSLDEQGFAKELEDGDLLLIGAVDHRRQPVVTIAGEVLRPNTYQFEPGMRLSDLLRLADGVTVDAHLAQVFVSRQIGVPQGVEMLTGRSRMQTESEVMVVDLNKVISGDLEENIALMPLDHVKVQSQKDAMVVPEVEILGAVKRPGTYQLTGGLEISDLIAMAGNLLPEAFYDEAELVRNDYDPITNQIGIKRYRIDLRLALDDVPGQNPILANGDRLIVRSLAESWVRVTIEGQVRFPGVYEFPANARITDLIASAGGVLPDADMRAARYTRMSVRALQRERFQHMAETLRRRMNDVLQKTIRSGSTQEGIAAKLDKDQAQELIARMAQMDSNGRVVLPFRSENFPASPYNLLLENGDTLFIPRFQETVSVIGHVFNPNAFVADQTATVESLIFRCGGLTEYADHERLYVIRADGIVQALHQRGGLQWDSPVFPGDVVMVPEAPMRRDLLDQIASVLNLVRSGAESALLMNSLYDSDLSLNWVANPSGEPGLDYASTILDD